MRAALLGLMFVAGSVLWGRPAAAIPVFAHRYGLTCQACHTEVPHLTPFGEVFLANGYRLPGIQPKPAFPVAVRIETNYASAGAADPDEAKGTLPKTIVNEIELLVGGGAGSRGSYWVEPYLVDGGFPGLVRDAWIADRLTPDHSRVPVVARAGQFSLPLPLDPETFRETTQPYAIWSLGGGGNPFTFFGPKQGVQLAAGNPARGLGATVSVLRGADTQSGLPSLGVDTMETLQRDIGGLSLSLYRYDGSRPLAGYGFNNTQFFSDVVDRFWRNGFGAGWSDRHTEVNAVYQIGNDTAADVYRDAPVLYALPYRGRRVPPLAQYSSHAFRNGGTRLYRSAPARYLIVVLGGILRCACLSSGRRRPPSFSRSASHRAVEEAACPRPTRARVRLPVYRRRSRPCRRSTAAAALRRLRSRRGSMQTAVPRFSGTVKKWRRRSASIPATRSC